MKLDSSLEERTTIRPIKFSIKLSKNHHKANGLTTWGDSDESVEIQAIDYDDSSSSSSDSDEESSKDGSIETMKTSHATTTVESRHDDGSGGVVGNGIPRTSLGGGVNEKNTSLFHMREHAQFATKFYSPIDQEHDCSIEIHSLDHISESAQREGSDETVTNHNDTQISTKIQNDDDGGTRAPPRPILAEKSLDKSESIPQLEVGHAKASKACSATIEESDSGIEVETIECFENVDNQGFIVTCSHGHGKIQETINHGNDSSTNLTDDRKEITQPSLLGEQAEPSRIAQSEQSNTILVAKSIECSSDPEEMEENMENCTNNDGCNVNPEKTEKEIMDTHESSPRLEGTTRSLTKAHGAKSEQSTGIVAVESIEFSSDEPEGVEGTIDTPTNNAATEGEIKTVDSGSLLPKFWSSLLGDNANGHQEHAILEDTVKPATSNGNSEVKESDLRIVVPFQTFDSGSLLLNWLRSFVGDAILNASNQHAEFEDKVDPSTPATKKETKGRDGNIELPFETFDSGSLVPDFLRGFIGDEGNGSGDTITPAAITSDAETEESDHGNKAQPVDNSFEESDKKLNDNAEHLPKTNSAITQDTLGGVEIEDTDYFSESSEEKEGQVKDLVANDRSVIPVDAEQEISSGTAQQEKESLTTKADVTKQVKAGPLDETRNTSSSLPKKKIGKSGGFGGELSKLLSSLVTHTKDVHRGGRNGNRSIQDKEQSSKSNDKQKEVDAPNRKTYFSRLVADKKKKTKAKSKKQKNQITTASSPVKKNKIFLYHIAKTDLQVLEKSVAAGTKLCI